MYNIDRAITFATWKIKKQKTKNLNVVYLLKKMMGYAILIFTLKLRDPPTKLSPKYNISDPTP